MTVIIVGRITPAETKLINRMRISSLIMLGVRLRLGLGLGSARVTTMNTCCHGHFNRLRLDGNS